MISGAKQVRHVTATMATVSSQVYIAANLGIALTQSVWTTLSTSPEREHSRSLSRYSLSKANPMALLCL